jgi:hypothetical protein
MATTTGMNQVSNISTLANNLQAKINGITNGYVYASLYTDLANLLIAFGRHNHNYSEYYFVAYGNTNPIATTTYTKTSTNLLTTL